MAIITKEELLKIAHVASIKIYDEEVSIFVQHVASVLDYAQRVEEIAKDVDLPSDKSVNVFREDVIQETKSKPLLDQAPEQDQDYFVVPMIIEK